MEDTSVNAMQVMKLTTVAVLMWMNAYRTFVAKEPNVSIHMDLMNVVARMRINDDHHLKKC